MRKSWIFSGIHIIQPLLIDKVTSNDIGTQYRSAVFYHDQKQKELAEKSKKDLEKEGAYRDSVVTEITPFKNFYPAEDYHKNYYEKHEGPVLQFCH